MGAEPFFVRDALHQSSSARRLHSGTSGRRQVCDMDTRVPAVVRMRVECARCGHAEDDTYAFDMPRVEAQPLEAYEAGECPEARLCRCT